jgi:hypothetical protein
MEAVTMSQISPPLRILLIGSVVFLAAWFAFLRPGGGSDTASAPAPAATTVPAKDPGATTHSAPGAAVQSAASAAQKTEAAQSAAMGDSAPATSTGTGATTATAPSVPKAAPAGSKQADAAKASLPLSVAKAMASKKVMVLLFWNPKAADDKAVRRAVKGIGSHKGKVAVHVANVADVARYAPITRGVDVQQSPSVVVVDRKLQAELLTGYVVRQTIEQSVSDALRAG